MIGSHNSWSYLPVEKWWMKPFAFMAKCQNVNIKQQYEIYGVRCFDLRLNTTKSGSISHGLITYSYDLLDLWCDLHWLNSKEDCYVRVLHEVRFKNQYTPDSIKYFKNICYKLVKVFPEIKFWCGRNLYNWEYDFQFDGEEPTCHEDYASVSKYKYLIGWWPWIYAKLFNKKIINTGTSCDILLIDYVSVL